MPRRSRSTGPGGAARSTGTRPCLHRVSWDPRRWAGGSPPSWHLSGHPDQAAQPMARAQDGPPGVAHGFWARDSPQPHPLGHGPPSGAPRCTPSQQIIRKHRPGLGAEGTTHTARETKTPSSGQGRGAPCGHWLLLSGHRPPRMRAQTPSSGSKAGGPTTKTLRSEGQAGVGVLPPQTAWKGPPHGGSHGGPHRPLPQLPGTSPAGPRLVARLSRPLGHVTSQPDLSPERQPHTGCPPDLLRGQSVPTPKS